MLNQVILVGRMKGKIKKEVKENLKEVGILNLEIPRNFKNKDGIVENDIIPVELRDMIYKTAVETLKEDSIIGIKGRLINNDKIYVLAEKVTYLSSSK